METYNLYYTLNHNLPSKKFPISRRKTLLSKVKNLDETSREAFLMLICEHAKLNEDFKYSNEDSVNSLPYEGTQKGEDVVFNIRLFPDDLCWILSKFLEVVLKKKS